MVENLVVSNKVNRKETVSAKMVAAQSIRLLDFYCVKNELEITVTLELTVKVFSFFFLFFPS